jgi:hypothetical protein
VSERPVEKTRRRWEHNIKMDLRKIGRCNMDWIDLAENRNKWWALLNIIMNLRVP